jgi:hypothetical protein
MLSVFLVVGTVRAGVAEEHDRHNQPGLTGDQSSVPLLDEV